MIILPTLILAEIVYILKKYYDFSQKKIANALSSIVAEENLLIDNKDEITTCLDIFRKTSLDFANCYLLAYQEHRGCEFVNFDKKLRKKKPK